MHHRDVERSFSRAVASYDDVADVQRIMADALVDLLAKSGASPRNVLEVGCGTGLLSERLMRAFPSIRALRLVDLSREMLNAAALRLTPFAAVDLSYLQADGEKVAHSAEFDLWISGATVQWFSDLPAVLTRLRSEIPIGGKIAFSCFGAESLRELYESYAEVHSVKRRQQARFWEPERLLETVRQVGFAVEGSSTGLHIESVEALPVLLRRIQAMGASNRPDDTSALTRDSLRRWSSRYRERFPSAAGGISATWEWIAVVATKV